MLEKPKKSVFAYGKTYSPREIEEMLSRIIEHLCDIVVFEGDLVSERDNLLPHKFHQALEQVAHNCSTKTPFMLSFEDEARNMYAYDQFTIIRSIVPPYAFDMRGIDPGTLFYHVLLTSTEYPEARREYHYWILETKDSPYKTSEWIQVPDSGSLPDFFMIPRPKGNLRDRRCWVCDYAIEYRLNINIDFIAYLYLNSIGAINQFSRPPLNAIAQQKRLRII